MQRPDRMRRAHITGDPRSRYSGDLRQNQETNASTRWVFDSPLLQDSLFVLATAIGAAVAVFDAAHAAYWNAFWAVPSCVMLTGTVGGSIRNFGRARHGAA
jgi:hypothetical protein